VTVTYCGRPFSAAELERIRELTTTEPHRQAVARAVCAEFGWLKPDGGLKVMSCKVALLKMERDGLITLPPPVHPYRQLRDRRTAEAEPQLPVTGSCGDFDDLQLLQPAGRAPSYLWNELMARYHYLGYELLPGAQIRYLVYGGGGRLLGALGFGAAAWKTAPRDRFIGWTPQQQRARLHLVVNNARFLILPWVSVRYLASHVLARAARQLPGDWEARYAYRPVLLETFVERPRFAGTCYRAANWTNVGQTQGRGKLDRHKLYAKPIKDIYLYPLDRRFRQILTAPLP
jgi:hypothetical protein